MRLLRALLTILILTVVPYSQPCASENYNEQLSTITLFYKTLTKNEAASVSEFFKLFGEGNEAELELILRQEFPSLDWKRNWLDDEKAVVYVEKIYNDPHHHTSRFIKCIKTTIPMFSSGKFNLQIESPPNVTKAFRKFTVKAHGKKLIFEFSQDEPYIENIYLPDGKSIYTLIEKCVGK
jgi:hypothetical protein